MTTFVLAAARSILAPSQPMDGGIAGGAGSGGTLGSRSNLEKVYMNPRSRQLAAFSLDGLPGY